LKDDWIGSKPLKEQFSNLYNYYPCAIVANVMNQTPWNISFRRALVGNKLTAWHNLVTKTASYHISDGRDTFTWGLSLSHKPGYSFYE
jgi:hypothetical protein